MRTYVQIKLLGQSKVPFKNNLYVGARHFSVNNVFSLFLVRCNYFYLECAFTMYGETINIVNINKGFVKSFYEKENVYNDLLDY